METYFITIATYNPTSNTEKQKRYCLSKHTSGSLCILRYLPHAPQKCRARKQTRCALTGSRRHSLVSGFGSGFSNPLKGWGVISRRGRLAVYSIQQASWACMETIQEACWRATHGSALPPHRLPPDSKQHFFFIKQQYWDLYFMRNMD